MKFFQKNQKKILAAIAILLVVMMLLPMLINIVGGARAVTKDEIDSLKQDAAALNQEKADLSKRLKALEGEINSAYGRKQVVEQEINVVNDQIANTAAQIEMYDGLIAQEEENLTAAQAEEVRYFDLFCQRVRAMEEEGTVTYWQILFNAADFNDLLDRAMMINEIAEYDNGVMDALEQARLHVEQVKAELEQSRADQVAAKEELDAYNVELQGKQAEIKALIQEMEEKKDIYEQQVEDLDYRVDILADEIRDKQAEYDRQIAAGRIQFNTGSGYYWPLPGIYTLSSLFGSRVDPFTGGPGNHSGIDIPAPYGTEIHAARGGVVSVSSYQEGGAGNYVVLNHGDGNSTRYYHMSQRLVKEGQVVAQGEVIGLVGSTGRSTGSHLHLEVIVGGVRQDPINSYPALDLWYRSKYGTTKLEH